MNWQQEYNDNGKYTLNMVQIDKKVQEVIAAIKAEESRIANRELIEQYGKYIQIFVSTPLSECEKRDVKGLYAKARAGELKGFTGIDDPYEKPQNCELSIDTTDITPEEAVQEVMLYLEKEGLIR